MATELRLRRGTTAEHATFTGALAEVTVDTTKKALVVHDGSTPGGFPVTADVAASVHAATEKTAPAATDEVGIADSAASWGLKRLTLANLRTWLAETFFSKAGGTISGNVNLPSLNGGQLAGFRNKIINGKMEIAQRGTSFPAIGNVYSLDRWMRFSSASEVATISQQADAPPGDEFQSSLRVAITAADSSIAAGDASSVYQLIEGYNARDLIGRPFTLSFWVRSSKVGVHCVSLSNSGVDRSYVAEYNISTANTWERKTVTVVGGLVTAGTWDWGAGIGLRVVFSLAAGSSLQTTAGAWQTGNFTGTANQVNCLDTVGNIFAVTGVQLEVGSAATPFEHRPYGMELELCQRYYYRLKATAVGDSFGIGYNGATTGANYMLGFPTVMRTAPTALEQSGTAADYSVIHGAGTITTASAVPTFSTATGSAARVAFTVASGLTAGAGSIARAATTNAYLGFSAEL